MLSSPSPRRRAASLFFSAFVVAIPALAAAQQEKAVAMASLNMVAPTVSGAVQTGAVPSSTKLRMALGLAPSNRSAMENMARQVSDPKSVNYHHFLSPAQIGAKYGASASTVNAAVSFLKSKGMSVTLITANRMAILFTGTASKVQSAFSTKLVNYKAASRPNHDRLKYFSYTSAPKVPASFAPSVVTIDGLQNAYTPRGKSTLTPDQTRTLYQGAALYGTFKGEGINIGITSFDGYRLSNLPIFYSTYGLPSPSGGVGTNVTQVSINGANGNNDTAGGEADLDIQLALAMAPLCNLYIYDGSPDSATSDTALATIAQEANDDVVDIISESYGFAASESLRSLFQSIHDQHVSMTMQGITYLVATGDYGTDLARGGADYPNMDPEILDVGGTVADVLSDGTRKTEDGWNGSAGGYSTFDISFNTLPTWQVGMGVPTNINRRLFPDLALHAAGSNDATTLLYYQAYNYVFGGKVSAVSGTSASCPTFAGELGLILQNLVAEGKADISPSGRPRLGHINEFIYGLDNDPSVFFDTITGDIGPLPNGIEATGHQYWDFVTGFGAPSVPGLLAALSGDGSDSVDDAAITATPTILTLSAATSSKPAVQLTLGTVVAGNVGSLVSTDGVTYTLQSTKQNGVGQVAAATIAVPLQTVRVRRSAKVSLSMQIPIKATGYIYLLRNGANSSDTSNYDLVGTVSGTGSMTSTAISLDVTNNTYIDSATGTVTAVVRALIPSRLGTTPFSMVVDKLGVTERVRVPAS